MIEKVPLYELKDRMHRFRAEMDRSDPDWKMVVIFSKINLYYFTGTMQEGMLLIPREDEATYWARRSYERALDESLFPRIRPMESYREASVEYGVIPDIAHMELEILPLAYFKRFQKYFPIKDIRSADRQINKIRAIKSPYELALMVKAACFRGLCSKPFKGRNDRAGVDCRALRFVGEKGPSWGNSLWNV